MSLDLDAIEQRAAAATPGPWTAVPDQTHGFYGDDHYDVQARDGNLTVAMGGYVEDGGPALGACVREDAEFIAHARSDVPALVAEVKRLRERGAASQARADQFQNLLKEVVADVEPLDFATEHVVDKIPDALADAARCACAEGKAVSELPQNVIEYLLARARSGAWGMNDAATARDLLAEHAPETGVGPHISIRQARQTTTVEPPAGDAARLGGTS